MAVREAVTPEKRLDLNAVPESQGTPIRPEAAHKDQLELSLHDWGRRTVTFGHTWNGKTYREVLERAEPYCFRVLSYKKKWTHMADFSRYVRAMHAPIKTL